jgi:hypothetical protein
VKTVGTVSRDHVEVSRTAVSVNGLELANSASLSHSLRGRGVCSGSHSCIRPKLFSERAQQLDYFTLRIGN